MHTLAFTLALAGLGLLMVLSSAGLFVAYRFERFVGLRYLLRSRPSKVALPGMAISAALTAIGLAALYFGRDHARSVETAGVVVTLIAGFFMLVFGLLRVFSVFTTVSTMGVVLGVASLVVVLAVTSGFEREFQDKLLSVNGHLLVMSFGSPNMAEREAAAERYMKKLADLPGLRRMSKFAVSAGEVMVGKVGATLKAIDVDSPGGELAPVIVEGKLSDLERPARCRAGPKWARAEAEGSGNHAGSDVAPGGMSVGRVMIGTELARRINAHVGDCINLLIPFATFDQGSQPASFPFEIVGLFHLGYYEYDSRLAYVSLSDARRLGEVRPLLFGVELRFNDPKQALGAEDAIIARVGYEPRILDWQALNQNTFAAIELQKLIIAFCLTFIILVGAFNILAALTMIVLSKMREMAILAAMGARRQALMRVFLAAGSIVGFAGVGFGIAYGLAICGLATYYGYPLDPKVYTIGSLPVELSLRELLFVACATQLCCLFATIYPVYRAGRLKVIEGLRYI